MASNKVMTDLSVRISTQTAELKKGLKQASGQVKAFSTKAKKAGKEFSASFKNSFSSLGSSINPALGQFTSMLGGSMKAMKGLTAGTHLFKIALAATGIGLVVIALGALVTWLNNTKEGMLVMSRATEVVKAVLGVLMDRIAKFGGAVVKLFKGDFTGAWEDAKGAVAGVGDEILEVGKKADQIALDADRYAKEEIANKLKEAELLEENGQLRIKARDIDKYTATERKKFAAQEFTNLKAINKLKLTAMDNEIDLLKRRQELGHNTIPDDEKLTDLILTRGKLAKDLALQEKELMMMGQDINRQKGAELVKQEKILKAVEKERKEREKLTALLAKGAEVQGTHEFEPTKKKKEGKFDKEIAELQRQVAEEGKILSEREQRLIDSQATVTKLTESTETLIKATIVQGLVSVGESIGKLGSSAMDGMKGFVQAFMGLVVNFAKSFGKLLVSLGVAKVSLEKIGISGVGAIIAGTALIAVSSLIGNLMKKGPGFANGGVFQGGGLATVGERGKEVVAMPNGSRVISHADTMKAISSGNGSKANIAVQDIVIEGDKLRIVLAEANRRHVNSF